SSSAAAGARRCGLRTARRAGQALGWRVARGLVARWLVAWGLVAQRCRDRAGDRRDRGLLSAAPSAGARGHPRGFRGPARYPGDNPSPCRWFVRDRLAAAGSAHALAGGGDPASLGAIAWSGRDGARAIAELAAAALTGSRRCGSLALGRRRGGA